jgi:hypothetical protein
MDPISVPIKVDAKVNADLKDATKLGGKMIDAISRACGVVYEPIGIVRKAKAERKAALIEASTSVEFHEIVQRAKDRFLAQQIRQQQNVDAIVARALEQPQPEAVSDEPCDTDWINEFLDCAKNVSNEDMQKLMAKILAGEVSQPNSFSRRTIHLVRSLGRHELEAFAEACACAWNLGESDVIIPLSAYPDQRFQAEHPAYGSILECQSMGLLHDKSTWQFRDQIELNFHGRKHVLRAESHSEFLCYSFAPSGAQLKSVVPTTPSLESVSKP